MTIKNPIVYNVAIGIAAVGLLYALGSMLVSPSEFHLHCNKNTCRYTASPILGSKTTYQFPPQAISNVWTETTYSKYGTFYHVYLKEADQQLELSWLHEYEDAEALINRVKAFQKAPETEEPLNIDENNKNGALWLLIWIGGVGYLFSLVIWLRLGKRTNQK